MNMIQINIQTPAAVAAAHLSPLPVVRSSACYLLHNHYSQSDVCSAHCTDRHRCSCTRLDVWSWSPAGIPQSYLHVRFVFVHRKLSRVTGLRAHAREYAIAGAAESASLAVAD